MLGVGQSGDMRGQRVVEFYDVVKVGARHLACYNRPDVV